MNKTFLGILAALLLASGLSSCKEEKVCLPEALVFSDTIDWQWELGEWYGGNSFYWWHNPNSGVEDLGKLPSDWKNPHDFENGHFHLRIEVLEQPGQSPFDLQLGFWQDVDKTGGNSECISPRVRVEGGPGPSATNDLGPPSSWWQLRKDEPVDFSRPADFYRIGLVLWNDEPLCLPMAQGWVNSQACEDPEIVASEFFPMKLRITVVAVADGHTFTGWDNYP